jgi:hypothetical protein
MSKGQIAMAVVLACKDSLHANTRKTASQIGMSHQRVHHANTVLEYTPDQAGAVLDGSLGLDAAYAEARARKDAASSMEAQMARLRGEDSDLADVVAEGRMTLRDALAVLERRRTDLLRRKEAATLGLLSAVRLLSPPAGDVEAHAANLLDVLDLSLVPGADVITPEAVERAIAFLVVVRRGLSAERNEHGRTEAQPISP